MAQEAPEAQTEDKTDPYGVSHRHLGGLPSELFDKILFEINSIRDLAHFIATARFAYQHFQGSKAGRPFPGPAKRAGPGARPRPIRLAGRAGGRGGGGGYVKWFGEGLHSIPRLPTRLPTRQSHSQSSGQRNALHLWRHAGFCLWDRKRVEALKGLSMFRGELYTGWVLNRSIERDD
ncbi:uncharacterized protein P884DRAFT_267365 [Thermothelomyces heterothallicus CBS 202.75]|uniref:uncharacterized protein n=1 Tax=Thermothelomyces heterothallicus CBS 202.75 TaxID=1149848 RepID=UPI003744A286